MRRTTCARIPTAEGEFRLCHYIDARDAKEHLALVMGDVSGQEAVLVRVHSECFTGDVLGSQRCDCGEQLAAGHADGGGGGRWCDPLFAARRPRHRAGAEAARATISRTKATTPLTPISCSVIRRMSANTPRPRYAPGPWRAVHPAAHQQPGQTRPPDRTRHPDRGPHPACPYLYRRKQRLSRGKSRADAAHSQRAKQ